MNKKTIIFILLFVITLLAFFAYNTVFKNILKSKEFVIAEIKEDLSDNNLNYVDKPSWLTNQALKILVPPLIDYEPNCYPYSKILKEIPSKDNNLMYLENKKTVMIIQESNFTPNNIKPIDIFPTIQILNLDNIQTKWVYRNLVENIDSVELINNKDVKISYKIPFSLPYFPSPVIFESKNKKQYEEQILNYNYKDNKSFSNFPSYWTKKNIKLMKNQKNFFKILYEDKKLIFKTYKNLETLKKELDNIDLLKIPINILSYLKIDTNKYKVIKTPNKEIFFIFFNPKISKNQRIIIYNQIYQEIKKYDPQEYTLTNSYILPYHYSSINLIINEKKSSKEYNEKYYSNNYKVVLTYKDKKSELMSNMLEDIIKKKFNGSVLKIDIKQKDPRKEIFGTYVEPPEPSLKEIITVKDYDFIITIVTFLPYMNYYYIYSKDGKYNLYSISTPKIENLLDKIMEGFSYDQKDYLEQLQIELLKEFYIVPLLIDNQCFVVKKIKKKY